MNNEQTPVEWLVEQMSSLKYKFGDVTDRNEIIRQAKEYERIYTKSLLTKLSDMYKDYYK
jgi:hypothetical protein